MLELCKSTGVTAEPPTAGKVDKCVKTRPKICRKPICTIKAHVSRFAVQKQVENAVDPPGSLTRR